MPTLAGNRGRMQATDSTAVFGSRGAHPVLRAGFRQAGCVQGITNIIKATGIVDGQVGRPPRIDFAEFYMHFGNIAPLVDVLAFSPGAYFRLSVNAKPTSVRARRSDLGLALPARPAWAPSQRSHVMRCIGIEKPADHALILRVMLLGFTLEELDAALAQCDRNFDSLFAKNEVLRSREEVRNDLQSSEGYVRVSDSRAHRFVCPFANSRHQVSGSRLRGT